MPNSLEFTSLPLVESHVRFVCDQALPGDFKEAMKLAGLMAAAGFPDVEHDANLRQPPGEPQLLTIGMGTPLALTFRREDSAAIRIQPNMIEAEWVLRDASTYPRFEALRDALDTLLTSLRALDRAPKVTVVNMSYSNLVDLDSPVTVERINDYLGLQLDVPGVSNVVNRFEMAWVADIDHRLTIEAASNDPAREPTLLVITTSAGKKHTGGNPLDALSQVHEFLNNWFKALLTTKAKNEFGLTN